MLTSSFGKHRFKFDERVLDLVEDLEWVVIPRQDRSKDKMIKTLNGALKLFTKLGFDEATIEDIAKESDVSATSIFRRFHSKNAILYTIYKIWFVYRVKEHKSAWVDVDWSKHTTSDVLNEYVNITFQSYRQDGGILRLFERLRLSDKVISDYMSDMSRYNVNTLCKALQTAKDVRLSPQELKSRCAYIHCFVIGSITHLLLTQGTRSFPDFSIASDDLREGLFRAAVGCLNN